MIGQPTAGLFRIAEADSDDPDEQSASSRPLSPRNTSHIPNNLISIIPTPINGSRDSLGDSLTVEPPESDAQPSPPERRNLRRTRRSGRLSFQRSDSSETPPPRQTEPSTSTLERLSPGYSQTARFMNETNESEIGESSDSAVQIWGESLRTPEHSDSGVGTVAGSSTRNNVIADDVSDDPAYK
ncbi:Wd-repeat protein, partial [Operophtera brumata]